MTWGGKERAAAVQRMTAATVLLTDEELQHLADFLGNHSLVDLKGYETALAEMEAALLDVMAGHGNCALTRCRVCDRGRAVLAKYRLPERPEEKAPKSRVDCYQVGRERR
jgi:hypothetical protein